jgi:hypothetical protein
VPPLVGDASPAKDYHGGLWKTLKRWPVVLALVVVLGGLAVAFACLPRGGRVTRENCERIEEGMTEAEVRAILGKPWDNWLLDAEGPTDSNSEFRRFQMLRELFKPRYLYFWVGDNVTTYVAFGDDNRVFFRQTFSDPDRPHSWLPARVWRRLRERLGW